MSKFFKILVFTCYTKLKLLVPIKNPRNHPKESIHFKETDFYYRFQITKVGCSAVQQKLFPNYWTVESYAQLKLMCQWVKNIVCVRVAFKKNSAKNNRSILFWFLTTGSPCVVHKVTNEFHNLFKIEYSNVVMFHFSI